MSERTPFEEKKEHDRTTELKARRERDRFQAIVREAASGNEGARIMLGARLQKERNKIVEVDGREYAVDKAGTYRRVGKKISKRRRERGV